MSAPVTLLRSVLFLPASNARAIEKARTLNCDAVILDLEDAVGPDDKPTARAMACEAVARGGFRPPVVAIRVNGLDTEWGEDDLKAVARAGPDVALAPKLSTPQALKDYRAALGRAAMPVRLWANIETCAGVLDIREIVAVAQEVGLEALIFGQNDLSREMGRRPSLDRRPLHWAMSLVVTAARAAGLAAIDGVFNDFSDLARFEAECREAREFGFDGKALIHPAQIEVAHGAFAPDAADLAWAKAVVEAFALPQNADRGAVRIEGGAMAERLHLDQARRMLQASGQAWSEK